MKSGWYFMDNGFFIVLTPVCEIMIAMPHVYFIALWTISGKQLCQCSSRCIQVSHRKVNISQCGRHLKWHNIIRIWIRLHKTYSGMIVFTLVWMLIVCWSWGFMKIDCHLTWLAFISMRTAYLELSLVR